MTADLDFLIGTFTGTDEVHASAWAAATTATVDVRANAELDGQLLVMHLDEERPDGSTFRIVNVVMTDPATGDLLLYPFDSAGFPPDPPARGSRHGNDLVFHRSTDRGSARTTFTPTPDGFRWAKHFRPPGGGEWQAVVTGGLVRR